jgi:hypothetical protein
VVALYRVPSSAVCLPASLFLDIKHNRGTNQNTFSTLALQRWLILSKTFNHLHLESVCSVECVSALAILKYYTQTQVQNISLLYNV